MSKEAPANQISNRYLLREKLGEGGMGIVYRATDRLTGYDVALKRVLTDYEVLQLHDSNVVADFRMSLAREFKLSASLRHPNIINVLDYGFDKEQQPYYTMELLENPTNVVLVAQTFDMAGKVGLLLQMFHALMYLHRRGIIHRDLKPANVLVVGGQVKVLDFGLSIMHERSSQTDSESDTTAGTLAYMAPEIMMGSNGDIRSDLYAVGMMGYEMMAGQHPFNLSDPATLINQVIMEMPDVDELDISVELALVLQRLLEKDPVDRFPDAEAVIDILNSAAELPAQTEIKAIRESFLQAARFVGRDAEMKQLATALESVITESGQVWLVGGESGVGKSRIIDELRTLAMVKGARVLRGQAIKIGSKPYQMWQMVLRWLGLLDDLLSDDDVALLKHFIPDVDRLLLRDVSLIAAKSATPEQMRTDLLQLLQRIINHEKNPVVMLFEDLHWSGSESLRLLADLSEQIQNLPVLVVATYRDDEAPEIADKFPKMQRMNLQRLDEAGIEQLSAAMLGDMGHSQQVVELLQRESQGNIFFIIEAVRALTEQIGNLEQIGRVTLPNSVFSGGVQNVILRRLEHLDEANQDLLKLAAVLGREPDLIILRRLAVGLDVEAWITACVNAAILESEGTDIYFAHDKLRTGLLETLSDETRRDYNQRIAEIMEKVYGQAEMQYTALAYHWGQAGNRTREEHFLALAGDQALQIGAFQEALSFFSKAQETLNEIDISPDERRKKQVHHRHRMAEANLGIGAYETARALYKEALIICENLNDTDGIARSLEALGNIAFAEEDFVSAHDFYTRSHEIYQQTGNQSNIARLLSRLGDVAYERGDQDAAKTLYQESLDLSREIGTDWGMAGAVRLTETVEALSTLDEARGALEVYIEALRVMVDDNLHDELYETIVNMAQVYIQLEDGERAIELLACLLHDSDTPDDVLDTAEAIVYQVQKDFAVAVVEQAWEKGKSKDVQALVQELIA